MRILTIILAAFLLLKCSTNNKKYEYYSDGKIKKETTYVGKMKNGTEKEFYPNGQIQSISQYKNDVLHGTEEIYFDNGKLSSRTLYDNGNKNGEFTLFYQNGFIASKGFYIKGLRHGLLYDYYPNDSGKVRSLGYIIIAENHEFLYYLKSYDHSGEIISDKRTLKIDLLVGNDSIDLNWKYSDTVKYDSMKIIIGTYKSGFKILKGSVFDTINFEREEMSKRISRDLILNDTVRGKLLRYKTIVMGDTIINGVTVDYFEETMKVYHFRGLYPYRPHKQAD